MRINEIRKRIKDFCNFENKETIKMLSGEVKVTVNSCYVCISKPPFLPITLTDEEAIRLRDFLVELYGEA